jgi:hypothetical protein
VRIRKPELVLPILIFYFVLSSSLLQTQTVFLAWILTSLFAVRPPERLSTDAGPIHR